MFNTPMQFENIAINKHNNCYFSLLQKTCQDRDEIIKSQQFTNVSLRIKNPSKKI